MRRSDAGGMNKTIKAVSELLHEALRVFRLLQIPLNLMLFVNTYGT